MGDRIRYISVFIFCMLNFSCTENTIDVPKNLKEYIVENSHLQLDEVIACAASDELNIAISYIFYYPIPSAKNIQYFETDNISVNKDDFSNYKKVNLPTEKVFNGYLERFIRDNKKEVWCIVTYESEGKFHKSNPIRLKHQTKPTEWSNEVMVDTFKTLNPKFIWEDGSVKENVIYFQVITEENNNLLSGTYTFETCFEYYNLSNVVLNITRTQPPNLIADNQKY